MTTSTNATEIVADPTVPAIHITREFDAPRDKVFRAHTDPDLYAQWVGPRRLQTRIDRFDSHTGGSYRFVQSGEDGREHGFYGSFHEVRPSEVIVQTFTWEGMPDGVALQRLVFEDLGDQRTRLTVHALMDSFAARDGILASGMREGVDDGYDKLDELLAAGR